MPTGFQFHQYFMSSFYACKSQKRINDNPAFYALLGAAHTKTTCRTLMKLTPSGENQADMDLRIKFKWEDPRSCSEHQGLMI